MLPSDSIDEPVAGDRDALKAEARARGLAPIELLPPGAGQRQHAAGEGCAVAEAPPPPPPEPSRQRLRDVPLERLVVRLPAFEQVRDDPTLYAHASRVLHQESNPGNARALVQRHGDRELWLDAAADSADDGGDGRRLRSALCARAAPRPMARPRSPPGT